MMDVMNFVNRGAPGTELCPLPVIMLVISLLAWACIPASAAGFGSVKRLDIENEPVTVHDKAEGWAEYPSLAVLGDRAFLAYGVSEGERSDVYYCSVERETGDVGPRHRIDDGMSIAFRPSICGMGERNLWLAWTSYDGRRWQIKGVMESGGRLGDVHRGTYITICDDPGLNSQVRVGAGARKAWFVWVNWLEDEYSIIARPVVDLEPGAAVTLYRGGNPVGRPDLLVIGDDHVMVVWDEYMGGRFAVRLREIKKGSPGPLRDLSSSTYANEWQPSISMAGDEIMVAWHKVPGTTNRCEPALALVTGGGGGAGRIDQPDDDETWRVRCLDGPDGRNLMAWATRKGYRRTRLYFRAASAGGLSKTVQVEFPMRKTFINWFDCEYNGRLALVYEYSGSLYFYDFELPGMAGTAALDDAAEGEEAEEARLSAVQERLKMLNYPRTSAGEYDEGYADEAEAEQVGGLADSKPEPRSGIDYSTEYNDEMLNVYFGDYHNHTSFSDGRAFPDMLYLFARDIRGLDFMCVSDHDGTLTPGEFAWNCAVCDNLTRDGDYICLPGYEENKGWAGHGYGHWNILLEHRRPVFHFEDGMTPVDLFEYVKANDAISIPHHIGIVWGSYNWGYFDSNAEPVVEICSIHGTFENMDICGDERKCVEGSMLVDGLDRGYRFGVVGGSDFHNCFSALSTEHSVTGVYAEKLTRKHILNAMRRRRTFATTGHMMVVDFRCNGKFMGEDVSASRPLRFTARLIAKEPFARAEIIENGEVVYGRDVNSADLSLGWEVENPEPNSYYYLRAVTVSGEHAWSSPIYTVR